MNHNGDRNTPKVNPPFNKLRDIGRRMLATVASRKASTSLLASAAI